MGQISKLRKRAKLFRCLPNILSRSCVCSDRTLIKMAGDAGRKDLTDVNHEKCKEIDIFEVSKCGQVTIYHFLNLEIFYLVGSLKS